VGHCRRKQRQQIFLFRSLDPQSEVVDDPARDPARAAAPPFVMTLARWRCVDRDCTYRPKSVSSLLILFNAIAKSVCVCWRVAEVGCCRVESGLWLSRGAVVCEVDPRERTG
jgi:hypothetical protein